MTNGLWGLGSLTRSWALASGWECWVQDTGSHEYSWLQRSIISENSHKSLHPNPRPSTTQLSAAPSAGCLTQRISKTGTQSQPAAGRLPIDTPKHTTLHSPAHQQAKTHFHWPDCRHKPLPTQSLHKPLDQPHPPGAETGSKSYDPIAWGQETSNTMTQNEKTEKYCTVEGTR